MDTKRRSQLGEIEGRILDSGGTHGPIRFANISLSPPRSGSKKEPKPEGPSRVTKSDASGRFAFRDVPHGSWCLVCTDFPKVDEQTVRVEAGCVTVCFEVPINLGASTHALKELCEPPCHATKSWSTACC